MYEEEKLKNRQSPSKKGAVRVTEIVNMQHGTSLNERTIRRYCQRGMAGWSPLPRGPDGRIDPDALIHLAAALESFIRINQGNGNGHALMRKTLVSRIHNVVSTLYEKADPKLLGRLLQRTNVNLSSTIQQSIEDRRLRWTTHANLKLWFDTWEKDIVELGFAEWGESGKSIISNRQLSRIINLDESCLSLDGNQGRRGGRPSAILYDPKLPQTGKTVSKSSVTYTFIGGSNAAGEALPPHFQFSTTAKTGERQRIKTDVAEHMHQVFGRWGFDEERWMSVTFGMNEKGGMDDEELEKYLFNSVVPLYPDAEDMMGKRVLIKIDSGPGRTNEVMLANLRLLGFYLYPGVPNTTSVSQETDQNYGLFKSIFRENLDSIVQGRLAANKSTSIKSSLIGLLVFGGEDPETKQGSFKNAFAQSFSKEKCLQAWAKVGAAPVTRACLKSTKVRHELGADEEDDPMAAIYHNMQSLNNTSVGWLNSRGFKGDQLRASVDVKQTSVKAKLTVPHSKERIMALKKAKSHGETFLVTGGGHCANDDFFIKNRLKLNEREVARLKAEKRDRIEKERREVQSLQILQKEMSLEKLKKNELEVLLLWHGVSKKDHPKGNAAKQAMWSRIRDTNVPPPPFEKWTEENEKSLVKLQEEDIDVSETALGRAETVFKLQMNASLNRMKEEERLDFIKKLECKHEEAKTLPTDLMLIENGTSE